MMPRPQPPTPDLQHLTPNLQTPVPNPYPLVPIPQPLTPFVGIDLTAGQRPSAVAALDLPGEQVTFSEAVSDDDLVALIRRLEAQIVAIDSPMGLPAGLCCLEETCPCQPARPGTGRSAERELALRGISCFWTTKRTIIKPMIYRAMELKERLEGEGYVVLEVYPYAIKRILLGRPLPKKSRPEGIARLMEGARALLPRCRWPEGPAPGHDQLDALFCAITARLFRLGETESLGELDEVPIIVPRQSALSYQPSAIRGQRSAASKRDS